MIDVARQRAERDDGNATFQVSDLSGRIPFEDSSLGGVLAILIVQHFPNPDTFVDEIRRCLVPGGYLLLRAPSGSKGSATKATPIVVSNLYWRLRAAFYTRVPGLVRFYSETSLRRLVESQGFKVADSTASEVSVTVLAQNPSET